MNYPIGLNVLDNRPGSINSIESDTQSAINDELLIDALAIVVRSARANGQTLADLTSEVLADDVLLEPSQRQLLGEIVAKAWEQFPI